jgi:ribosomal protein S4
MAHRNLKYSNAYKRLWRNQRNYDKHLREASEALARVGRSKRLMYEALDEMVTIKERQNA